MTQEQLTHLRIQHFIIKVPYWQHNLQRDRIAQRLTFVYWQTVSSHCLCVTLIYTNSQGSANPVECWWIPVAQKDEFFLPVFCVTWWMKKKTQPIQTSSLAGLLDKWFVTTYTVDVATSDGPCSRGSNSQTPFHYSWAQTLGWMGPCCRSPSGEQSQDTMSRYTLWLLEVNLTHYSCFLKCRAALLLTSPSSFCGK